MTDDGMSAADIELRKTMRWNPEPLRKLMDEAGLSIDRLNEATGISKMSLFKYLRGENVPGLDNLMCLADYFAIPMDYLVGRCDLDTAESILHDYASHFMEMRKAPYEAYLVGRKHMNRTELVRERYEAPWPYNLLDDIVCPYANNRERAEDEYWNETLNASQEEGLRMVLDGLSERERECVYYYYRDGLTLEGVGEKYGVSRERIRQLLAKAVRKMRHPARRRLIDYGPDMIAEESEYKKKREELDRMIAVMDEDERVLSERLRRVSEARLCLQANGLWSQGVETLISDDALTERTNEWSLYRPITTMPLEAMDLSVRSYNCLKRRGMNTLGQVMDVARNGDLVHVRNLGRKSIEEVLNKIRVITGEDYSALYGVKLYV